MDLYNLTEKIKEVLKTKKTKIIFCDGDDDRIKTVAKYLLKNNLSTPQLLYKKTKSDEYGMNIFESPFKESVFEILNETLKSKFDTNQIKKLVDDELYFGCALLKNGYADGLIAGANRTTADTVRATLYCLGVNPNIKTVFGFFLVSAKNYGFGDEHWFLFADCAVIPNPSPKQFANIAISCDKIFKLFFNEQARIAFLSFSTNGSAKDQTIEKIYQTAKLLENSNILFDGELQVDAAIDETVAKIKNANLNKDVAGKANVFIFPDLNSGNISYKILQRLGNCRVIGPILWGLNLPVSDLSRGANIDEILDTSLSLCYIINKGN